MDIKRIGIIGCGIMGAGIAQPCATHGYDVLVLEEDKQRLDDGLTGVRSRLKRDVERARLTVRVKDTPGFICKTGLNHAIGPLATADFIGLDTLINISEVVFEEYGEPHFKASTMLRRMVSLNHLGRKSGRGFFDYSQPEAARAGSAEGDGVSTTRAKA